MFFLITFIISLLSIFLTWTPWASSKIGFGDIFHYFHEIAGKRLLTQGLSIFAFAFFLHAILQSQTFESLFASKRKWLEKKKYLTIGLITVTAALLSSQLSWFDEFVYFYPLVIPLMITMGFDVFSSVICLYGGSIVGLMGSTSSERMNAYFGQAFGSFKEGISYNGMAGMIFRVLGFLLFTSIIVLFNVWYCSRKRKKNESESSKLVEEEKQPPFNATRKIILAIAAFFLFFSIIAQVWKSESVNKVSKKIPKWVSSEEKKTEYKDLGRVGQERKEIVEREKKMKSYWDEFGSWEERTTDCWFIIGAIIICLLAKQSIVGTLTTAIQSSVPLLLVYIFAAVPASILGNSGISNKLAKAILPDKTLRSVKYLALIPIFGISFLASFFVCSPSITATLIASLAPTLAGISSSVLIYAAIFSWTGSIIGMAFSPNNGILAASLEKSKLTYKQFIKKTWVLWLALSLAAFGLVTFWTWFNIK